MEAVQGDDGLRRRDDESRRGGEAGGGRNVSADRYVHAAEQVVGFELEAADGRLDVVRPFAAGGGELLHDRLRIQIVEPFFMLDFRDGEFVVRILRIDVGDADEMVRSRRNDHREAAVDGHDVDAAAVMVYMASHQVDTARRTGDDDLLVAVFGDEMPQNRRQLRILFRQPVGGVSHETDGQLDKLRLRAVRQHVVRIRNFVKRDAFLPRENFQRIGQIDFALRVV